MDSKNPKAQGARFHRILLSVDGGAVTRGGPSRRPQVASQRRLTQPDGRSRISVKMQRVTPFFVKMQRMQSEDAKWDAKGHTIFLGG